MQLQITAATLLFLAQVPSDELKEAVKHWQEWKQHYTTFHGSMVLRNVPSSADEKGSVFVPRRTDFAVSGEMIRADQDVRRNPPRGAEGERTPPAAGAPQRATCLNEKYGFMLTRDSPESNWVVLGREWTPAPRLVNSARGDWTQYVWAPFTVMEVPLCDLVQRDQCQVESLESVLDGDKRVVELRFSYTPSADELSSTNPSSLLRGGQVTLDPARKWCILRSRLELKPEGDIPVVATWSVDYEETEVAFPRVTNVEAWSSANDRRKVGKVERLEFTSLPRSEFTLTAYGLPEPELGSPEDPSGTRARLAFMVVNVVVVAVLLFFGWRRLRRRSVGG